MDKFFIQIAVALLTCGVFPANAEETAPTSTAACKEIVGIDIIIDLMGGASFDREGLAQIDMRLWNLSHMKTGDFEVGVEAQKMLDDYSQIDAEKESVKPFLPAPRFLRGSPEVPDLKATSRDTLAAFNNKRIDRYELDRQAALIEDWRRFGVLSRLLSAACGDVGTRMTKYLYIRSAPKDAGLRLLLEDENTQE